MLHVGRDSDGIHQELLSLEKYMGQVTDLLQGSKSEMKLYEKLRVKKWKNCMPTYNPSLFDPRQHTWEEIAQVTCQAELGHETIVVLSFVPILAGHWLGGYPAFIITSILAAMFDMMFVIMQRYNRQRILKLIK